MKTGNTGYVTDGKANSGWPQWSPAMKTGNTHPPGPHPHAHMCLNGARP